MITDLNELLSNNPVWINRLKNIGLLGSHKVSNSFGVSGPLSRSLAKSNSVATNTLTEKLSKFISGSIVSRKNDCLDRY